MILKQFWDVCPSSSHFLLFIMSLGFPLIYRPSVNLQGLLIVSFILLKILFTCGTGGGNKQLALNVSHISFIS